MQQVASIANEKKSSTGRWFHRKYGRKQFFKFPDEFSENTRDVSLKGEAFFEVAKDHECRFIIHSRLLKTTVVGTSFNVVNNDSLNARAVVVKGIVKVMPDNDKAGKEVKLLPQEAVTSNVTNQLLFKSILPDDANFYRQTASGTFIYNGVKITNI